MSHSNARYETISSIFFIIGVRLLSTNAWRVVICSAIVQASMEPPRPPRLYPSSSAPCHTPSSGVRGIKWSRVGGMTPRRKTWNRCELPSRCEDGDNQGKEVASLLQSHRLPSAATILFATRVGGSDDELEQTKDYTRYHLIWSPNFWKKMLLSMLFWLVVKYAIINNSPKWWGGMILVYPRGAHACHDRPSTATYNIILPLLSSSCCAIQLLMNALTGWGCAGFNSYLGPIRPIVLPLLLVSTWKLMSYQSHGWTVVSFTLAFLPELVAVWNMFRTRRWQRNHIDKKACDTVEMSSLTLPSSSNGIEAKLTLNIPTMGCVACVNQVDASIRGCNSASAHIKEEMSWLTDSAGGRKGGSAELIIRGRTNEEVNYIVEDVVAAVNDAGFRCDIDSLTTTLDPPTARL